MGEMKDIGKLAASLRRHAKLHEGIGHTDSADAMEDAADLLEPLADLLEKHGSIEQTKLLCEAGEKLPRFKDGPIVTPEAEYWFECEDAPGEIESGKVGVLENEALESDFSTYYSTKEAALKALKQEKGE